ncbi:MAG: preprotein translocase subunit SecA [Alphaproteobacteria bacterium]|nr:preprotein translocase subunit SecA [Alphaproteobacteria bacterium]
MLSLLARRIFGTANERTLKSFRPLVERVGAFEADISALSDDALKAQTQKLREKLANGATLDDILPEAFATVREAGKRVLGMRHFDVQLIGGMVLHKGMISEMRTGEGKTLVATLPAYLNALEGKGVHVVTVNDYLAKRDSEWMGGIHRFLGLSVGCILHGLEDYERREAYGCDITYATNNELGFDYLRDNMKYSRGAMVQRPFNFAIVDEVDSILVDEARTPLIISGPTEDNSELYKTIDRYLPRLETGEYEKDEKSRTVTLTDAGVQRMEDMLSADGLLEKGTGLYDISNVSLVHHVQQSLRAYHLFTRDVDYIVKDDKVIIIDEFTGRMMEGRRYSEGLHQALEAKERVSIQNENQTLASITFQNYFRLYPKLSGMTGTAMTEATEFRDIYKLEVVEIPTNVPVARKDADDEVYRTAGEKHKAIIKLVHECHERGQPVLVGTTSIEKSEMLAAELKKAKIPHQVLNARYHEKEAYIIAQAGRFGAVTIATNMAGRGTDIMLGGNPDMLIKEKTGGMEDGVEKNALKAKIQAEVEEAKRKVIEAGGLYVIGTERHESRRIDNQLRGRSGRQGDPGASKFFLSLEDDLMRIFGSERMDTLLRRLGLKEDEAIFHPWMNKALEKAQSKVEARNYDIRKNLLKFDDVMNDQRKVIFEQRLELMDAENVSDTIAEMDAELRGVLVSSCIPEKSYPEQWDTERLEKEIFRIYGLHLPAAEWAKEEGIADLEITGRIQQATDTLFREKKDRYGEELMQAAEKRVLLQTLDQLWKDHLLSLDHLRQGISLRAYGQRDPLNEYKQEAFQLFEQMLLQLREWTVQRLAHLEIHVELPEELALENAPEQEMHETRLDPAFAPEQAEPRETIVVPLRSHVEPENRDPRDPTSWGKVGRNEPCPCGSGKKFKHCHGELE